MPAAEVQPELNVISLRRFLDRVVSGGVDSDVSAQIVSGGRSNPTFDVSDGSRHWILRRPPFGQVLPTAHDMAREFKVLSALQSTVIPVPRTIAYCSDTDVIGAPFYVMDRIAGVTMRTHADTGVLTTADQSLLGESMVGTLAALHELDVREVGLADFGQPNGFLERQVSRWRKQWAAAHTVERPEVELLLDRLSQSVPIGGPTGLIHGDFKIDNVMVAEDDRSRILGVLDWEMSTLGDTLADVGVFVSFWDEVGRPFNPVSAGTSAHSGFQSRAQIVERYSQIRGIELPSLDWYVVLAYVKIAIILEQIHTRHSRGLTVGDGFDDTGAMVMPLLENAMQWASASDIKELRI